MAQHTEVTVDECICVHVCVEKQKFTCRVYPYLCRAVRNYARDWGQIPSSKEFYISFTDVPSQLKYVDQLIKRFTVLTILHLFFVLFKVWVILMCSENETEKVERERKRDGF